MVEKPASIFWREWLESDEIGRHEMLKSIAEKIDGCRVIDDHNLRIHCIVTLLKSYLEDFEEVCGE